MWIGPSLAITSCRKAGSSFDPDASSYFNNINANGGTMTAGDKTAINDFTKALKTANLWNKIYVINPMAGNDLGAVTTALKYDNAIGPYAINNNFVSGDYTKTFGLKGDGLTKYLNSLHKPSTVSNNGQNLHMTIISQDTPTGRLFGVFRTALYTRHYLPIDQGINGFGWGSQFSYAALTSGIFTATREVGQPSAYVYKEGAQVAENTTPDGSQPSDWPAGVFVSIGSTTGDASESIQFNQFSLSTIAGYAIGNGLNATEAANYNTAWSNLLVALGRR